MSKEESAPAGGLLSKVVRFVRHPTVDWGELDAAPGVRSTAQAAPARTAWPAHRRPCGAAFVLSEQRDRARRTHRGTRRRARGHAQEDRRDRSADVAAVVEEQARPGGRAALPTGVHADGFSRSVD